MVFFHLKRVIKSLKLFGPQGIMEIGKDVQDPCFSSCITGGMERQPIAQGHNKRTQKETQRGILKENNSPEETGFSLTNMSQVFQESTSMPEDNNRTSLATKEEQSYVMLPLVLSI